MKVEIIEKECGKQEEWKYPLVVQAECDGSLVLAIEDNNNRPGNGFIGIRLTKEEMGYGVFRDTWRKSGFKPFTGKLVLSNE